jgi:hypothetical protein
MCSSAPQHRVAGNLNVAFEGIDADVLTARSPHPPFQLKCLIARQVASHPSPSPFSSRDALRRERGVTLTARALFFFAFAALGRSRLPDRVSTSGT